MKYRIIGLVMLIGVGVFGVGGSCSDAAKEMCGDCGTVANGDSTISGDARIDGLFTAVGTLCNATASIQTDFRANLEALAVTFGAECAGTAAEGDAGAGDNACASLSISDLEAQVKAAISGEISANVNGGLHVNYAPPKCSANVSVAVDAEAKCEAKADCDVSADCTAGSVDVNCSGECSGSCSGTCSGGSLPDCKVDVSASGVCEGKCSGSCELQGPSVACEGACNGTCTVEAGVQCTGTCDGNCTGTCDGSDVTGVACAGQCEGQCDAQCHIQGAANCSGSCNGKCEYTPADGSCSGTCKGECRVEVAADATCEGGEAPHCNGTCEGSCSAECNGTVTPPSCDVSGSCDASADCQASASAQASASLECTPPSLEIGFDFNAGMDASAKASFTAKLEELKVRMAAIVQGMFKLRALVDADYAAEIGITSPVDAIKAQVQGFVSADFSSFNVPVGLIPCVVPALQDSIEILGNVVTDTTATVSAQLDIFTIIQ